MVTAALAVQTLPWISTFVEATDGPASYTTVQPERLLDTRIGIGSPAGLILPASTIELDVTRSGTAQVPDNAAAVILNVTVTEPTASGWATLWPCGGSKPTASNVNFAAGQTIANLTTVRIGAEGRICIGLDRAAGHIVADLTGWHPSSTAFTAAPPERLLDTRLGLGAAMRMVEPEDVVMLDVTGTGAIQVPEAANAVVLNVTATGASGRGWATVWPCGRLKPNASNVNFGERQSIAALVVAQVGHEGHV